MKKFFAVMLVAMAVSFAPNAQAAENISVSEKIQFLTTGEVWDAQVVYGIDFLALRSGPSTSYPILVKIPPGARITAYPRTGSSPSERGYRNVNPNFIDVTYRGVSGFAHKGYIRMISGQVIP